VNATQNQARGAIQALIDRYRGLSKAQKVGITEAGVVHQFLDPLFEALGWPIHDPQHYLFELHTEVGRPDVTLKPEQGGSLFVEAKRFGVIKDLHLARDTLAGTLTPGQLALPGIATDRTPEEQQAINYAFGNNATWAILTNFEKLRLFNARRDWLVLSFEWPGAYLDDFDLLWQLSHESVCAGALEALSSQRHREDVDTPYLAFINEWRERLAQDIVSHPDDNPWAFDAGRVRLAELRAAVQRVLDRLVVVRFAEDHLIVPAGTLYGLYEVCRANPYTFTLTEFTQRLYRRFDEYHDSALFAPHLADQAVLGNEVLGGLVQKLYAARYRALSADIMGNTYEQYLGKTLDLREGVVRTVDNLETRKKQGSYYTPQVIVRYLVDHSLGRTLYGTADGRPGGEPLPGEQPRTSAEARDLRVLDAACGSGGFLIYAYPVLAEFYRREIERLAAEIERIQDYPRLIVETHLYGVDLDPQAAEIATVNLMMRAMADLRAGRRRLPLILNQNVKVGNSLIGAAPGDPRLEAHAADLAELRRMRLALAFSPPPLPRGQASLPGGEAGAERDALYQASEAIDARLNASLDAGLGRHFADAGAHRPFHWPVEFPEAFVDEAGRPLGEAGGVQVIVGNPPWEILKPDLREFYAQFDPDVESKLTRAEVERRIAELDAQDLRRAAAWQAQKARIEAEAAYFSAAPDYRRQGRGDRATHKLFLERAYRLLRGGGRLGYVVPSGIYTDLGTKELRQMLLEEGNLQYLFSFSNERFFFPDVHHAFKFVLLGAQKGPQNDGFWAAFRINPRVAIRPEDLPAFLAAGQNLIYVTTDDVQLFNPHTLSFMEFPSARAYAVCERIYADRPVLGDDLPSAWNLKLSQEIHSTNDRDIFNTERRGLPLREGKHINQYDAFYSEPRFHIEERLGRSRILGGKAPDTGQRLAYQDHRLAHRRITGAVNERSMLACVLPKGTFCSDVAQTVCEVYPYDLTLYLVAVFNSLVMDFLLRLKITNHADMHFVYSLPVPRLTAGNPYFDAIVPRAARLTCTRPEFAALWQEVMGGPWDPAVGATDPAERQALRDELDALVAHLYGLSRDDLAHILGTFPLTFPDTEAGWRRKEALLGMYERFAAEVGGWDRGHVPPGREVRDR
jgi:SAM-dependent methyltransferase